MAQNSLSAALNSSNYDVTVLGTLDWALFGTNNTETADSYTPAQTKSGGGGLISAAKNGDNSVFNYADPRTKTWSGGTPTASGSTDYGVFSENVGGGGVSPPGYTVTLPADTTVRSVRLYVGAFETTLCTITATLSDASAGPSTDTTTFSGVGSGTFVTGYIDVTYQAASGSQTLTVSVIGTTVVSTFGNTTLQAVALKVVGGTSKALLSMISNQAGF